MKNNNLLLLLKLPPPITGATIMNQFVDKNPLLRQKFNIRTIKIHYSKSYKKIGKQPLIKLFTIIKIWFILLYELISFNPRIIYFQISPLGIAFYRDLIFIFLIKIFRVRILYHLHGKGINDVIEKSKIKKILYKTAFRNNYIICLSELVKKDIKYVYNQEPFIVNNGLPVTIKKTRVKRGILNYVPVLLFISNIRKQKGIFDFIDLCSNLKNQNIKYKAEIIGQERDLSAFELNSILLKKGIDKFVTFLGPKFGNDKTEVLLNADILIHPVYNEAWGLVLLEAMEASLPVVSTFEGSIPYIVEDNITGYICNKGDFNCLMDKTIKLINNKDLRIRMGQAGRKRFLDNFTIEHFNINIFNVIKDVSNKH